MSLEKATTELERSLLPSTELSASTYKALKRLRKMLLLENKEWGPDLVIKAFNDWDKVFFNRRLKGHVELCWRDEKQIPDWVQHDIYGHHLEQDISWRWRHVKIELNANRLLLTPLMKIMRVGEPEVSPFRAMWGVFLHECCHAYLGILAGSATDEDERAEGYDGAHGVYFQRCIYAVDRSARAMLGVAAACNYSAQRAPQKPFDVKNHKVIPRDPKVPVLKSMGILQTWRTCVHMARVLLRA